MEQIWASLLESMSTERCVAWLPGIDGTGPRTHNTRGKQ